MTESLGYITSSRAYGNLIAGDHPIVSEQCLIPVGQNLAKYTMLGKILRAAGTPAKTGTGNGTVSGYALGKNAKLGNYIATCKTISPGKAAGTPVKTGTGNGAMGTVTLGAAAQLGDYILTCKSVTQGRAAGSPADVGTGNGTMTGVSVTALAKVGTYTITCVTAVENGGIFKVIDPDGERLDDAIVGTAYNTGIIDFTINDGSADFIVGDYFTVAVTATDGNVAVFSVVTPNGEQLKDMTVAVAYNSSHLSFTLADGTVDFIVGDYWTISVAATDGNAGVFSVVDPDGVALKDATVGVAYASEHINFTINDGSVDYVVGDYWTFPVAAGSGKRIKSIATAVDGSQDIDALLPEAADATSAELTRTCWLSGEFNENSVVLGTGHTVASVKASLRARNVPIYLKTPVAA